VLACIIRPGDGVNAGRSDPDDFKPPDFHNPMNPPTHLHELVAAAHTPFHADGSLASEVVAVQAEFLFRQGIRTVFITGSTGESHSLSQFEKHVIHDAWAEAAGRVGLRVIAHVGSNCLADARELAAKAAERGFHGVSALAPSYYKPGDLGRLVDCCAEIASAAPKLPFYYYDIPVLTGVEFPMVEFLRLAPRRIPNLAGIKYTNPDLVGYRRAFDEADGRYDLPWGVDESLLAALVTGARGAVGSTYNWAPQLYQNIISAYGAGRLDEAAALQSTAIAMIDAIAASGFLGTAKALMGRLGVPVGPARLPLGNPQTTEVDALMDRLNELGFDEWGARPLAAPEPELIGA
jgi:N-acetylneuraminate lyase